MATDSASTHPDSSANDPDAQINGKQRELAVWNEVATALGKVDPVAQRTVLKSVITFLQIDLGDISTPSGHSAHIPIRSGDVAPFAEEKAMTAKEFLRDKRPTTDVDRVACLAYYLTHYSNTPHFKTLDISKLNTDAAQIKFSNAAAAVDNATRAGLLVPATKGNKQISAHGEAYVQALPDKLAAKAALDEFRTKKRPKKSNNSSSSSSDD